MGHEPASRPNPFDQPGDVFLGIGG